MGSEWIYPHFTDFEIKNTREAIGCLADPDDLVGFGSWPATMMNLYKPTKMKLGWAGQPNLY